MPSEEDKIREELKDLFEKGLARDVSLRVTPSGQDSEESTDLTEFIKDMATLSGKLKVEVLEPARSEGPMLTVGGNLGYSIVFMGAPAGLEIQSLIKAILLTSQGEDTVQGNLKDVAKKITEKHEIEVFVSAKCSDCPMPVFYLLSTAVANPEKVSARIIMTSSFPSLTKEREVKHLPTFFTDGKKAPIETDKISIGLYFEYIKGLCA